MIASAKLSTEGGIPDSGGKIRMQNLAENLDILAARLEPRPAQAEVLDKRMRTRLADSLSYIGKACEGRVSFDDALHQIAIERIRSREIPAQAFAAYGDLVLALDENEVSAAENLFAEIAIIVSAPNKAGLFRFRPSDECAISKRYLRWMDTDPTQSFRVLPVTDEEAMAFSDLLAAAWRMFDTGFSDLAAETRHLAREIIMARGDRDPKAMIFDGASSFLLWGAILINVHTHKTPLALLEALVHESGHNLLFGYCADGPLVENADSEQHPSPLRVDPRPMDGIVHATYVTARMHMAVRGMLRSRVLSSAERQEAQQSLAAHERGFESGLAVIEDHGKLTPLGYAAIAGAKNYMRSVAT